MGETFWLAETCRCLAAWKVLWQKFLDAVKRDERFHERRRRAEDALGKALLWTAGAGMGSYEWHNQNMQNTWNIATLLQACMWLSDASERTLHMTEELGLSKCAVTILDRCTEVLIWIYFYHVYLSMYEYTCNHVTCVVYSFIYTFLLHQIALE